MNSERRKRLKEVQQLLGDALWTIDDVLVDERDALDNMPENLQSSKNYERMEEAIDCLEDAMSQINDAIYNVDKASE